MQPFLTDIFHILFHLGDVINRYYFPIFIPIGITGNILSFLVGTLLRNRYVCTFSRVLENTKVEGSEGPLNKRRCVAVGFLTDENIHGYL